MFLKITVPLLLFLYVTSAREADKNGGTIHKLVFKGKPAVLKENKHLVKLIITQKNLTNINMGSYCSGSIISEEWILTAAHCFKDEILEINVEMFRNGKMETIAKGNTSFIITKDYIHSKIITPQNSLKDIALVKFTIESKYEDYVKPIKLAKHTIKSGQSAIAAGYGASEKIEQLAPLEGAVTMVDDCYFTAETTLLCSRGSVRMGSGDSGGPLVSKGVQVGIIVMGNCGSVPTDYDYKCESHYVDVVPNLPWIREVVQNKL